MGQVVVFSKTDCPHCVEAKDLLKNLDIPFAEIDINSDINNSLLMSRVSGRHTVPQIFFNNDHLGGAGDLQALGSETIKQRAEQALQEADGPAFLQQQFTEQQLREAVLPIKDIIAPHLPADPTVFPEYMAVRTMYSNLFGFLCNLYEQMILKPEEMALFTALSASSKAVFVRLLGPHFGTACFATATTAGCTYCSAHGADLAMKYAGEQAENFKAVADYLLRGQGSLEELPYSAHQQVIINLAAKMTTNSVKVEDIAHARRVYGVGHLRELCNSVGAMGILMGFLNRFNDLVGAEIEASIKQSIDGSVLAEDWDWGTHDTEATENRYDSSDSRPLMDPDNPDLVALIGRIKQQIFSEVADMTAKHELDDEQLPKWLASFPDTDTAQTGSTLYHALLNTGSVAAETKHLAAYLLTLVSGHEQIAAEEKRLVLVLSEDNTAAQQKLQAAQQYAESGDMAALAALTAEEQAALRLARCAAEFPHIVRGELVLTLDKVFSAEQIIELVMAFAVIGSGQRWLAIHNPLSNYLASV